MSTAEETTSILFDLGRFQVIAVSPWFWMFHDGFHGRTRAVDAVN